ncbi:MAG: 3-oxoacyl-ACP synthase [Flavobacterium sp.]|nr:MAG: 3-oxoacyl-ACP synthase [Flavobacterium sp.]
MMENNIEIISECHISDNRIIVDGKLLFELDNASFPDFSKQALRHLEVIYPKFFKMDNLSKLAFLGAEILLKDREIPSDTALVFANRSSSLDTDVQYSKSIADKTDYYPSPAVFVYTLPNICLGEISIRHQLKSENSFFIFDAFNRGFLTNYAAALIQAKKASQVLCGWTEYFQGEYTAALFLVKAKPTK